jgi:hypothetical protein
MIFVECNADLALVQSTTHISSRDIVHDLKGKGAICSRLSVRADCIALLDEDPGSPQPPYLKKTWLYSDIQGHDIRILHDSHQNNYLILLVPKLENWILRAAKLANLDVRDYNLPANAEELHRLINYRLEKLQMLVTTLMKVKSPMVMSLKVALGKQQ